MRRRPTAAALSLAAAAVWAAGGCEPAPEPSFPEPDGYAGMFEPLRVGTRAEVEDFDTGERAEKDLPGFDAALGARFGTPAEPEIFTRLPVRFGAGAAVVADAVPGESSEEEGGPDGPATIALEPADPDGDLPPLTEGEAFHWTDYDGFPRTATVAAADPEAGTVQIEGVAADDLPAPGDRAALGGPDLLLRGRAAFVTHCVHCHGTAGAGDGPTAKYLFPAPRNYLPGVYKFTSTGNGTPSRADLTKVLREGIPGTYMPAFSPHALDDAEIAAVVEYLRWLSMRGQFARSLVAFSEPLWGETAVAERLAEDETTAETLLEELVEGWDYDVTGTVATVAGSVADGWAGVDEEAVTPDEPRPDLSGEELADSVFRGRDLYLQGRAQCVSCHGTRGLGNGPQTVSLQTDDATGRPYEEPGLHDVWGEVVLPRNLTRGIYRGGRRPVDLYRRIYSGIAASRMPAFGDTLQPGEIWDLVNFVLALPHDPSLLEGATPEPAPTAGAPAVAVAR